MAAVFPKIYPILDSSYIPSVGRLDYLERLGSSLADAGVEILEYRNKLGTEEELISDAVILRRCMKEGQVKLILDDRADLVEALGLDGVHVDHGDVRPSEARRLVGPARIVGTFGGSQALVEGVLQQPVDYWSIGPALQTVTKRTSTPPIGVEGVRRLRNQAGPDVALVGVGGITLDTAQLVLEAGATAVAVCAAIFSQPDPAAEFRLWTARLG